LIAEKLYNPTLQKMQLLGKIVCSLRMLDKSVELTPLLAAYKGKSLKYLRYAVHTIPILFKAI